MKSCGGFVGTRQIKVREGWSRIGENPVESGWYQRYYGDEWVWIDWWDAQGSRWLIAPNGRRCVMQGKAWKAAPPNLLAKKKCLPEPTG